MPEIKVLNMAGENVGTMTLSDAVFAADVNGAVLHAAVVRYLGNQRQGTQSTLTRTEVSGGGRKPWKQKGTGRARQGSTRSPQWTHGGVALGPKPRLYKTKLNKKVRRTAMISALSSKVASGDMIVLDKIETSEFKTKIMVKMLSAVGAKKKSLVVLDENDLKVRESLSNIPGVKVALYNTINVYDILNCDSFIVAKGAAEKIQEVYA
ncbi:MAG: 50S ribosomal protein L4 [Eubacteriales bacterium]|nr:50S ribosomal protein L4 [Clostridia bacterium]MDY2845234.1 50S ribosomal protein L4 [Eubacteriales bacterium]